MRKFLAVVCSVAMLFSSIGVMAATDPYEFNGDVNDNPWADLFTTTAPEVVETTTVEPSSEEPSEPEVTTTAEETSAIVDRDDNVALNKTATASSELFPASNVVDGDIDTRWESEHGVDPQWLQVYLQGTYLIDACLVTWEAAAAETYEIQVSMDGESWDTVSVVTQGKSSETRYFAFDAVEAKYVRVYGTSRTMDYGYSLYELEVYGSLVAVDETTTTEPVEVAPSAPDGFTWAGNDNMPHYFAWAPVDNAVSYNIYVNDVLVGNSTGENYNFDASNFAESGTYNVAVTAVSESGLESEKAVYSYVVEVVEETTTEETSEDPSQDVETTTEAEVFTIVSQPQNIIKSIGSDASMAVEATGKGLTYSWEMSKDGGLTWATSGVDGHATAKIIFTVTEAYHGRQYRCIITDEEGNTITSEPGTVIVEELKNTLTITAHPKSILAPKGNAYKMTVGAMGNGLTYSWEMSKDGGATWTKSTVDGYATSEIIFTVTEAYHGRQYRCVVTDENGDTATSNPGTIIVEELKDILTITAHPKSVTAPVGNAYKMTVGAMGNGLTYSWEMSKDGGATWTKSTVDGHATSEIIFTVTEAYHGRQYRCVVTDENGDTATSNPGIVVVEEIKDILTITAHPKSVTAPVGKAYKMAVGAMGNGLTYSWEMSKDGGLTWTKSTVDGYATSEIIFTATEAYHGRQDRCVVTDENGDTAISNPGVVIVEELKDILTITAHPKSVVATLGTAYKMSVGAVGKDLTYSWEMSKDGGATWTKSTVDGYATSEIIFTVTAAYAGRQYRCVITDADGNSVTTVGAEITIN